VALVGEVESSFCDNVGAPNPFTSPYAIEN